MLALLLFLLRHEAPLVIVRVAPKHQESSPCFEFSAFVSPIHFACQLVPASLSLENVYIVTPLRWPPTLCLSKQTAPPDQQRAGIEVDGALGPSKLSPSLWSALEG